ncbi:MAG: hypothetical protein A3G27_16985 [Betaproteobacteria bacterium RIFCSPLOWO2_12_FULL_66_14]|nr:MAG: hypothetical protein A3G27_16985 [Betaproteobacteria bacterium RIFCSPLOWO2_12_FULL_66_14]
MKIQSSPAWMGLAVLVGVFLALPTPVTAAAWGQKSNICGSWNNYCRGAPPSTGGSPAPSTPAEPSPEEIELEREQVEARRKQEEARKREEENRSREEAERQRRLSEEQARERQEFLRNKSEAIRSLKGVDFDGSGHGGSGLKSLDPEAGTATFGIPPDPGAGLRSLPHSQPQTATAWREPLFSKGSQFSAPVDIREKDPSRLLRIDASKVDGLVPGGDLGRFLSEMPWPAAAKADAAAGFLMWERGNYAQAHWYLSRALAFTPGDKFLQSALGKLRGADNKARAKLPPRANQAEASAAMVAAEGRWAVGDTATALRMVERAERLWPGNPDIQKSLRRAREIHAAREDLPAPAEVAAEHERAALWARGQAAFKLGLIMAAQAETSQNREQRNWAMIYLAEAGFALKGRDRQLIDDLRERLKRGEPLYNSNSVSGNSRGFYPTKADAMLDALEYGKGNWDSCFRYLRHIQQAFPSDQIITTALVELATIRESGDSRVSRK